MLFGNPLSVVLVRYRRTKACKLLKTIPLGIPVTFPRAESIIETSVGECV